MTIWRLLIVWIAIAIAAAAAIAGQAAAKRHERTLAVIEEQRNYRYGVSVLGQEIASISCKRYHSKMLAVSYQRESTIGYHISCKNKEESNKKLVVWIHGGPWAYAREDLVLEQLAFLDGGYDLFIPLYPGSSERQVALDGPKMVPDVVDALAELRVAYRWGFKRYQIVDVVGESFGAFLAASLAPDLNGNGSLFLVNPNLGGQSYLATLYAGKGQELEIAGVPKEVVQTEAKRINEAYFRRLQGYAPLRLLESATELKLKLVYGGKDALLIPEEIQALSRSAVPGCGIDYRANDGHEFAYTREQYEAFRKMIRCGQKEKGRHSDQLRR